MHPRRRRPGPGRDLSVRARARALAASLLASLAAASGACSLTGLDSDYAEGDALASPDASVMRDAQAPLEAATAYDAEASAEAADADAGDAADGDAARLDGETDGGTGKVVCPHIDAGLSVCDDSPAHATPMIHCADAGSPTSADFYACGTNADCMNGSLCVDEGFCKPTCTASIQCADDSVAVQYGATSCNPITK